MNKEINDRLIGYARTWIDTPWRHKQCSKGLGVDCWQIIRDCYETFGIDLGIIPDYSPRIRDQTIYEVLDRCSQLAEVEGIKQGRILVFRLHTHPHHLGIATDDSRMIHADNSVGRVVEQRIPSNWLSRLDRIYEADFS